MSTFKINLRKERFYLTNGKAIIGNICFSVNNWYFPKENWNDFVVTLLYWITRKLIRLKFKEKQPQEMDFMEGPFKVSIYLDKENQCTINFIEGEKLAGDNEIVHKTITLPFEEVKDEVKKACKILIDMKESKELDFEDDYQKLKESYELLCKC